MASPAAAAATINVSRVATLERRLAGLPVVKHRAREVVLIAGSKTGGVLEFSVENFPNNSIDAHPDFFWLPI
jgi:hypothetical protein